MLVLIGICPEAVPALTFVYAVLRNPAPMLINRLSVGANASSTSTPLASASPTFVVTSVGICAFVTGSTTTPAAWRSAQIVSNTVQLNRILPLARSERIPTSVFFNVDGLYGNNVRTPLMLAADTPPEL